MLGRVRRPRNGGRPVVGRRCADGVAGCALGDPASGTFRGSSTVFFGFSVTVTGRADARRDLAGSARRGRGGDIVPNGPRVAALSRQHAQRDLACCPSSSGCGRPVPRRWRPRAPPRAAKDIILLRPRRTAGPILPMQVPIAARRSLAGAPGPPELCGPVARHRALSGAGRSALRGRRGGTCSAAAAGAAGAAAGLPVATGGATLPPSAVGCRIVAVPAACAESNAGTAGHVVAEGPRPRRAPRRRAQGSGAFPMRWRAGWLWLGLIMAGGLSLSWLRGHPRRGAAPRPAYEKQLERWPRKARRRARAELTCPFLEGAATPHGRPDARGAFLEAVPSGPRGRRHDPRDDGGRRPQRARLRFGAGNGRRRGGRGAAGRGAAAQLPLWCQVLADFAWREGRADTAKR